MIWWTSIALAGAWRPAELRQLTLGPVRSVALAPHDGALTLFVAGDDGVRALDPLTGAERARSDLRGSLHAAPDGLWVCGDQGVARFPAGPVVDRPCEEVAGPPLATVDGAASVGGPALAILVEGSVRLPSGDLRFDGTATGLVTAGGELWVTDGPGRRLGFVLEDGLRWSPVPLAPDHAAAADLDADGCPDLVLADSAGSGAVVLGVCGEPPPVVARTPVPVAPEQLEVGARWGRLEVRVGDELTTRIVDPMGRKTRWSSRGGPPGFTLSSEGELRYRPTAADIGRWRISVRARRGIASWSGVELRVWPSDGTVALP